jgi:hypothetical protein
MGCHGLVDKSCSSSKIELFVRGQLEPHPRRAWIKFTCIHFVPLEGEKKIADLPIGLDMKLKGCVSDTPMRVEGYLFLGFSVYLGSRDKSHNSAALTYSLIYSLEIQNVATPFATFLG